MIRIQLIKRLAHLAVQLGMKVQKYYIHIFFFSIPTFITFSVLIASFIQVTTIYLDSNKTFQTILAIVLFSLSLISAFIDRSRDSLKNYERALSDLKKMLGELKTIYYQISNSKSKTDFVKYEDIIVEKEKYFNEIILPSSMVPDSFAKKRFMKQESSYWIHDAFRDTENS